MRLYWQIVGFVTISVAASCLAVTVLPEVVCNYLVPMTLVTAMIALFYIGIGYQRNMTKLLEDNGLLCGGCNEATIPRPDRIHTKSFNPEHGISDCYNCGTDLTNQP